MSPEEYRQRGREEPDPSVRYIAFRLAQLQGGLDYMHAPGRKIPDILAPPRSVVELQRNLEIQELSQQQNESILQQNPLLCTWVETPENAYLAKDDLRALSWWEQFSRGNVSGNVLEFFKAAPGAVVSESGIAAEGVGQLMAQSDPSPIVDRIARAGSASPEERAQLRYDISHQGRINPAFGHNILSEVESGSMSEADVRKIFEPTLAKGLQDAGKSMQDYGDKMLPATPGFENSFGRTLGKQVGSTLPAAAITVVNPTAGIMFQAAVNAGKSTVNARMAKANEHTQTNAAFAGLGATAFDIFPGGKVVRMFSGGPTLRGQLRDVAVEAGIGGSKEAGKELAQNFIAQKLYAPNKELSSGVGQAFLMGFSEGLVTLGTKKAYGGTLGKTGESGKQSQQAETTQRSIAEISEQATSSNVRSNDPDAFRDYVNKATKGTPIETIYIRGDKFNEIVRRFGDDPNKVIESLPGMDKAEFSLALSSNGDIKLPVGTYAASLAGSKYDVSLRSHMRFDLNGKTPAEGQEFMANESKLTAQAKSDAETAGAVQEKNQTIANQERQQDAQRLQASGVSPEQAQYGALALDATRGVRSAKNGQTREDYSKDNPPNNASLVDEGQISALNGVPGKAAGAPSNRQDGLNAQTAAAPAHSENDHGNRQSTPAPSAPIPPSTAAASMPMERFKRVLQSSTAPAGRLESPSPSPEIFNRQGPAVPTETPWSDRRKTLNRNRR